MLDRTGYWSQHLAAIESEGISTKAYAQREGLSVAALYQWRSELKVRGANSAPKGFVAVKVTRPERAVRCLLKLRDDVSLELSELPSPQWVAALCAAMTTSGR